MFSNLTLTVGNSILYFIAGLLLFAIVRRLVRQRQNMLNANSPASKNRFSAADYHSSAAAPAFNRKTHDPSADRLKTTYWVNHRTVSSNPNFGAPDAPAWPPSPESIREHLYLSQLERRTKSLEQPQHTDH